MAEPKSPDYEERMRKPVVWLHGEVKTPPFSAKARQEAGMLLRLLQQGEKLAMPLAESLPIIGIRCGTLRVRDGEHNWRIMYRTDADAVVVLDVYAKKTREIPGEVIRRCKARLKQYDDATRDSKKGR
jgi:phage-related protein